MTDLRDRLTRRERAGGDAPDVGAARGSLPHREAATDPAQPQRSPAQRRALRRCARFAAASSAMRSSSRSDARGSCRAPSSADALRDPRIAGRRRAPRCEHGVAGHAHEASPARHLRRHPTPRVHTAVRPRSPCAGETTRAAIVQASRRGDATAPRRRGSTIAGIHHPPSNEERRTRTPRQTARMTASRSTKKIVSPGGTRSADPHAVACPLGASADQFRFSTTSSRRSCRTVLR